MRRQLAKKALLVSPNVANTASISLSAQKASASSSVAAETAPFALTSAASLAYKSTVRFAREQLFTTNHRTTEYFSSNEKTILEQLRAALGNSCARASSSSTSSPSTNQPPFWLVTKATAAAGSEASADELSLQLYKHLGVDLIDGANGNNSRGGKALANTSSSVDLTTTIRNMLALRSHHGFVLSDQMLVLSVLAICGPLLAQRPDGNVIASPAAENSSSRLLSADELNCSLPTSATSPTIPSAVPSTLVPPALLDVLGVLADDQRLPLHPLLLVALTALIRHVDANTGVQMLRYRGGIDSDRSNTTTMATIEYPHLSHTVRRILNAQLRPLLHRLQQLCVLVNTNAGGVGVVARSMYGDASADSISNQWFGTTKNSEDSIDLFALYTSLTEDLGAADAAPFRRRNDGKPLSALERSMLSSTAPPPPSSAKASEDKASKSSAGGSPFASITTTTSVKTLHLKFLVALAELAASLAAKDVLRQCLSTLLIVHEDVIASAMMASSNTTNGLQTDPLSSFTPASKEHIALCDTALQMIGYGLFMDGYVSSSASQQSQAAASPSSLADLAPAVPSSHPFAAALNDLLACVPTNAFSAAFPTAAAYWAAALCSGEAASASVGGLLSTLSSASTASSPLTEAVRKELEAIMHYKATVLQASHLLSTHIAPTQESLEQLLPTIAEGESFEAAEKALLELKSAEFEQLWSVVVGSGGEGSADDSFFVRDVMAPAIERIEQQMRLVAGSKGGEAEAEGADAIAADAIISTALRTILESLEVLLVAPPPSSAGLSSVEKSVPRIIAYATERFDYLGSRVVTDDPLYNPLSSASDNGSSAPYADDADANLRALFKPLEYKALCDLFTAVNDRVTKPLLVGAAASLQPRTIDLLLALQTQLVSLASQIAEAEGKAQSSLATTRNAAVISSPAAEAFAPLLSFAQSVSIPLLRDHLLRIMGSGGGEVDGTASASVVDANPLDAAALVGGLVGLAVATDELSLLIAARAPIIMSSTVIKPFLKDLLATYLRGYDAEMRQALSSAAQQPLLASDTLGGKGRKGGEAPPPLSPAAGLVSSVPLIEVFGPPHGCSFTSLFVMARRVEDAELCLMLRSVRTDLFN